jgi:site-specific DNA recombinase
MHHPEAKRMLSDIKRGHITGLIFSKLARLARNTKELLEFADIFRTNNADLVSLQESIDTASPAGRFFYTTIAAMAQWEREEIADRVRASVPVRAKLGKSLGGEAPYGYKWVNKELVLDENEAPIRRLMFALFAEVKRKRAVAQMLTERGYRTRRGLPFNDGLIHRCLADPIAKGLRRTNYTESLGEGRHWKHKPKGEWVFQPAPAIVSEELWEECNRILGSLTTRDKTSRRRATHAFSGIVLCTCGTKMYFRTKSPSYVCSKCKNKIKADILEEVFHEQLRTFLFSDRDIEEHLVSERNGVHEKQELIRAHDKRLKEIRQRIDQTLQLYYDGKLDGNGFEEYHAPLRKELEQNEEARKKLQVEVDAVSLQSLSNQQVVHDARDLHSQ